MTTTGARDFENRASLNPSPGISCSDTPAHPRHGHSPISHQDLIRDARTLREVTSGRRAPGSSTMQQRKDKKGKTLFLKKSLAGVSDGGVHETQDAAKEAARLLAEKADATECDHDDEAGGDKW